MPQQAFTRQLVEHTFNLDIPPHIATESNGTLLKILFRGDRAEEGVLSAAAIRYQVAINLVHGKIEYIGHRPIGLLVVLVMDSPLATAVEPYAQRLQDAVQYITAHASRVEALHA